MEDEVKEGDDIDNFMELLPIEAKMLPLVKSAMDNLKGTKDKIKGCDAETLLTAQEDIQKGKDMYEKLKKELEKYSNVMNDVDAMIKSELDPLSTDYTTWDVKQIIRWIISLDDGQFTKYEAQLKENMENDHFKGSDLCEIDKSDLKVYGINNFSDRTALCKAVQELVKTTNEKRDKKRRMNNILFILFFVLPLFVFGVGGMIYDKEKDNMTFTQRQSVEALLGLSAITVVLFITAAVSTQLSAYCVEFVIKFTE